MVNRQVLTWNEFTIREMHAFAKASEELSEYVESSQQNYMSELRYLQAARRRWLNWKNALG